MTLTFTFHLGWVLIFLALLLLGMGFWTLSWERYANHGIGGGVAWMFKWFWVFPTAIVLGIWAIVEFVR
jgi:hypothetical protein